MREEREICSRDELFDFLVCNENKMGIVTKIATAKIHPEYFFTDDTLNLINFFQRKEHYGIEFFYKNWEDIPNYVLQALDIIKNQINEYEHNQYLSMKKNSEKKPSE
jgi:uncharacterized protein (DUF608 family)